MYDTMIEEILPTLHYPLLETHGAYMIRLTLWSLENDVVLLYGGKTKFGVSLKEEGSSRCHLNWS